MARTITSFVLTALALYSGMISGCWSARESEPARLVEPNSNVRRESAPPDLEFPKPDGFVNDFAGVLAADEAEKLESRLRELQKRGKIDLVIAIVRSTNGKDIFDYSLGMAEKWKIGSENGGALLVVAIEDRNWRIQIDKKLEKKFMNAETKAFGDMMVPHFREQKYNEGIKAFVQAFAGELARKYDFEPINF